MLAHIGQLLYLMAPAYLANMAPPFVRFWTGWNRPINERWLGSHKTVIGAVAGVCVAMVAALLQARIHWSGGSCPLAVRSIDFASGGIRPTLSTRSTTNPVIHFSREAAYGLVVSELNRKLPTG